MPTSLPTSSPTEEILSQIGLFFRRSQALFEQIKPQHDSLERSAYVLLSIIDTDGPARLSTLAAIAQLNLSTISRQIAALEAADMIIREPDPHDGRASLVRISRHGRAILERSRDNWRVELSALLADWTHDERADFARLFTRLNTAMAKSNRQPWHTAREPARSQR